MIFFIVTQFNTGNYAAVTGMINIPSLKPKETRRGTYGVPVSTIKSTLKIMHPRIFKNMKDILVNDVFNPKGDVPVTNEDKVFIYLKRGVLTLDKEQRDLVRYHEKNMKREE
jgi:hypothetical protein